MVKKDRPDLGKLSVAILEARVKSVIGEDAIKILKRPLEEAEIKEALENVLIETEKRFEAECADNDIVQAILRLTFSDFSTLREALRKFYDRPSDPDFSQMIREKVLRENPGISEERVEKGVSLYLNILHEELASTSDEIRQKVIALAILGIYRGVQEMVKSDQLYRQFAQTPTLSRYIRIHEFQTLVDERTKNFVGRDFIIKALDGLLQSSEFSCGYIVINGEPGIGKTALIAQLVKTRGYVHHFNIAAQNIRSTSDFLSNLCAQLIIRYDLDHSILPEKATQDSGFLVQLLTEAVEKASGRRLVVLMDALDEAEDSALNPSANRLYLPPVLPEGVFFVITAREKEEGEYRLSVDHRKDIFLRDEDPANLEDVRQYIRNYIHENKAAMSDRIAGWGVNEGEFIAGITAKSQGNFMYLVHVLREIREGQLTADNVDSIRDLPLGLKEYYQRHWRTMRNRDRERFEKYQKPVVCILATVREPVTIEMVAEWTTLAVMDVKDVVSEWREFLNVDQRADGEPIYRVYHTSFQEFLRDAVGLTPYHRMIAGTALKKIQWQTTKKTRSKK